MTGAVILCGLGGHAGSAWASTYTAYVTHIVGGFSTVTPLVTATNTPGGAITAGPAGLAIAITPDGQTAYVSGEDSVTPITLATGVAGPTIQVAGFFASGIARGIWKDHPGVAVAPDGNTVYVTSGVGGAHGFVTPVATATNTPGVPIGVARSPVAIAITPDGTTAYVVNASGGGMVTPITLSTGATGTPIPVVRGPGAIAITPDGRTAYVAGDGGITPITLATNTPGPAIAIPGQTGIAIAPDGRTAYVTDGTTVTPISIATDLPGRTIATGGGWPGQIAITPDGKTAYVTSLDGGRVTPITLATGRPASSVSIGKFPFAIAIRPTLLRTASGSMTCSPASLFLDQSTTCTVTVRDIDSGTRTTPTGTISFKGGPTGTFSPSQCSLSGTGAAASCQATYTALAFGSEVRSLPGFYSGDAQHSVARGLGTLQVSHRTTSISVDCRAAPLTVGQPRGCTATVTDVAPGAAITPTGTVAFSGGPGDQFIRNNCWLSIGGTAPSCSVIYTPTTVGSGSHAITATYTPNQLGAAGRPADLVHAGSTATVVLTVLHSTSTTLTCAAGDLTAGQSTTCLATVTDTSPDQTSTPTGTVAFAGLVGDAFSAPCVLQGTGATASCQVTYTAGPGVGAHGVTARYPGDVTHHPSNATTTITVARP